MKLIFLDIDGVMNSFETHADPNMPHEAWNPELMARLGLSLNIYPIFVERINKITEETGARIVISSSWRIGYLAEWADVVIYLHNCGLKGFIVGRTPWKNMEDCFATRGEEINGWFEQHPNEKIESFIVIDDNTLGEKYTFKDNFIQTNFQQGIQDIEVEIAIKLLK